MYIVLERVAKNVRPIIARRSGPILRGSSGAHQSRASAGSAPDLNSALVRFLIACMGNTKKPLREIATDFAPIASAAPNFDLRSWGVIPQRFDVPNSTPPSHRRPTQPPLRDIAPMGKITTIAAKARPSSKLKTPDGERPDIGRAMPERCLLRRMGEAWLRKSEAAYRLSEIPIPRTYRIEPPRRKFGAPISPGVRDNDFGARCKIKSEFRRRR